MPQIAHTKSIAISHTGINGAANVVLTDARHYTRFLIDAVHTNVTGLAIQVNCGGGWRSLFTSKMGSAQEVTLDEGAANMVELAASAKGGVRLVVTDDDEGAEITINVMMTGSLFSEARK